MFMRNNKPIFNYGNAKINSQKPIEIKSKNKDDFNLLTKKKADNWDAKPKDMDKPNPRMRAKIDLINQYYTNELINASQYELFKKHLHHHTKKHIKRMLVEIHRRKKSFNQAHSIAEKMDEEMERKKNEKKITNKKQ